jgi:hypothetical protein
MSAEVPKNLRRLGSSEFTRAILTEEAENAEAYPREHSDPDSEQEQGK